MAESKVQKVARKAGPVVQKRTGKCGHTVIRVKYAPQKGSSKLRWYCETCFLFADKNGG